MAAAEVCPVVGTTNTVLPPTHPDFDLNEPGLVCPVTKATTDHHHNLSKHPPVHISAGTSPGSNAAQCPALAEKVKEPDQKAMDEAVCPVVGTVTSVLPPDHPSVEGKEGKVCPVTNATLEHHKDKVHEHPRMDELPKGAVCPVTGIGKQ